MASAKKGEPDMNETLLKQYAEFAVKVGVNPQKGQTMLIACSVESAYFARLCAQAAFEAGARDVVMKYADDQFARLRMQHVDVQTLEDVKPYVLRSYLDYAESEGGVCILNIHDSDPEVFKGLDAQKIARATKARREALAAWREYTMKDKVQWSIVAIPGPAWAQKVFPGQQDAEEKLWQAIFRVCRVQQGTDVAAAWREHLARLEARRNRLNELCLESIHFESGNGTDLTVGLADSHTWEAAGGRTPEGYEFLPNIPTEEVFTAPHKDKVDGVVHGTKPYVYNGEIIDGFWVRFEHGRVVEYHAEKNEDLLGHLLDTDEGARHIGEVALVPASSPINQSGILFYSTLFDENAACHIAFGAGYPGTVKGGNAMTKQQLAALGVNDSLVHEDVMIGAADTTITGKTKDGQTVALFQNGEWVF